MAERLTVARPYAKAAFARAQSASRLAPWSGALARAAAAIDDPRVRALVGNPRVAPAQLAGLIADVAGLGADDDGKRFIALLVENKRLALLPEISRLFDAYKDEVDRVVDVSITSAAPMAEAEQAKLGKALGGRFGRTVRVHTAVDPTLIGGAIVRAGDLVIDGSLKAQLEKLAFELTA